MLASELTFQHTPRIDLARFEGELEYAHSPVTPEAAVCYAVCLQAGLDPAIALGFFYKESSYGLKGRAVETRNWGNVRKGRGREYKVFRGFAYYHRWSDSLADWCQIIKDTYIVKGLTTVALALPKYAPDSDGNDPQGYAQTIARLITRWTAPTRYRVMAAPTLTVRSQPNTKGKIVGRIPTGAVVSGAVVLGEQITGFDDPATPEPARQTNGWVQITSGYVSLAWLQEVKV